MEQYLFLTTSHDGSESITIAFTPVRIVCNNTLNAALNNCSNTIKIKHTSNAQARLKEVPKIMGMVNTLSPLMEQAFNQWSKIRIMDTNGNYKRHFVRSIQCNDRLFSKCTELQGQGR